MYDDKEIEAVDKAMTLITEVEGALQNGVKHYRKSDGKLLTTTKDIILALSEDGGVIFEPK